jgi:crossover junction endodeoxyribonuclease RusA
MESASPGLSHFEMGDEDFRAVEMTKIFFPWLDSRLSPNKRIDRRALIGVKQDAKTLAMALTQESRLVLLETDLQIKITFCPPDKRRRDLDNLYATFKPYQDGIFEALRMDDSLIDRVILQRGEVVKDGCVIVELTEA